MADFTFLGAVVLIQSSLQFDFPLSVLRKLDVEFLLSLLDFSSLSFSLALRHTLDSFVLVTGRCRLGPFPSCAHVTLEVLLSLQSFVHTDSAMLLTGFGNMDAPMLVFDPVQSDSLLSLGLNKPFELSLLVGGLSHLAALLLLRAFQHLDSALLSCLPFVVGEMDATELRLGNVMFVLGFARMGMSFLVLQHVHFGLALFLQGTTCSGLPCVVLYSLQPGSSPLLRGAATGTFLLVTGKARVSSALSALELGHYGSMMPLQSATCLGPAPFAPDCASLGPPMLLKGVSQLELLLSAATISNLEAFALLQTIACLALASAILEFGKIGPALSAQTLSRVGLLSPVLGLAQMDFLLPMHRSSCLDSLMLVVGLSRMGSCFSLPLLDFYSIDAPLIVQSLA